MPTKAKSPKKVKAAPKKTLVYFLLDRTGSMSRVLDATIESYNAYIDGLRNGDQGEIEFSLITFDSTSIDKVCLNVPIKDAVLLNRQNYVPRASTPLIDAAVTTINAVDAALAKRDDKPNVVVCIQTDGDENASVEHTMNELNALVKERTNAGWQFNFMGAGIDAYAQARMMGFSDQSTIGYSKDLIGSRAVFGASAANTRGFASGLRSDTTYTDAQRKAAGDKYAPTDLGAKPLATTPAPVSGQAPEKRKARRPLVDPIDLT